ncbi:plastid/chloroplast ribosomal protein L33 [Volvox carteri f. nagariensis]|uniref:Plastid/chloroplast ribosomal protein L33 n=1 Tax=Volvox carteri f. nagariensis TaxID=3068 RepID=D8TUB9_VOLCA|nr:plastid/chloroplast ribosomal protein L33 [Volvox carteri f. nagariensis]EFJ49012.1 plastid/chloroplast ribosomal protein L33 [Volvox carteri f. nagariensis]|eukprot:XP_002949909.1 plastid/chloroplast ribosomal protein L33 [Volvox carteri f. nagariensis]
MQSVLKSAAPTVSNPFMGNKMSYRVAAAPVPCTTAFRQVTTMAKKKGVRLIVTIECTESKAAGATPSRYVTQKNRKNTPERLELMKYNPNLRRHTLHKEVK